LNVDSLGAARDHAIEGKGVEGVEGVELLRGRAEHDLHQCGEASNDEVISSADAPRQSADRRSAGS
jgi:hypothetical protein